MGKYMVGIVILNYMNYNETISCVDSVLEQKGINYSIVVVDNGSVNESYKVLAKRYYKNPDVHVIHAGKNYGFAKGNNIGIKYVRERFGAKFVLLINSDTQMIYENYIEMLVSQYKKGIGVIGSEIILRNGSKQKPYVECVGFPGTLVRYADLFNQLYGTGTIHKQTERRISRKGYTTILHGCAFMLTPDYFEQYDGLYSKTFLYCEESLLYIMCERAGLKQLYTDITGIYHKEDQSSLYLYNNNNTKKLKYIIKSYKYVVLQSFINYIIRKGILK